MVDNIQVADNVMVVQASEILARINNKDNLINYDGVTIQGDLDVNALNLSKDDENILIVSKIKITNSKIDGQIKFKNVTFREHVSFENTEFGILADFGTTRFQEGATFEGSTFGNNAIFTKARFGQFSDFSGSHFKHANFSEAHFTNWVWFKGAHFNGYTSFHDAQFKKIVLFENAWFGNDNPTDPLNQSIFSKAKFYEWAVFQDARFNAIAGFSEVQFNGQVSFRNVQFNKDAVFDWAQFDKDADFLNTCFCDTADFSFTHFRGNAFFNTSKFNKIANFRYSYSQRDIYFDTIKSCKENSQFNGLLLTGSDFKRLVVPWNNIENHLVLQNPSDLNPLIKNYNELGWFDDADHCYLRYKILLKNNFMNELFNKESSVKKKISSLYNIFIYFISLILYGHGIQLIWPIIAGILVLLISAYIYYYGGQTSSFYPDGIKLSAKIFITTTQAGDLTGFCELWSIIERFLGALLLVTFLVVLAKKTLR